MGGAFLKKAMGWLPDWKWKQQKKGGGKGWQKKTWGGNKWKKTNRVNTSKTIWIGNIPPGATFKELKELGDQVGGCKWAEVYKFKGKNTGAIGFASAEEAANAIPSLNGALIGGQSISADSWNRKSK